MSLFQPRGIALVGASSDPDHLASRPLKYLARTGFEGAIYPVNPRHERIGQLRCYPDLASVPEPVDLALVSVPASGVPEALQACAARGVKLAVVLSAGLGEDLCPPNGLLVMGPNSMGFVHARGPVAATWNSTLDLGSIRAGSVALIAQSGGLGGAVLNRLLDRGIGVSWAFWSGEERFLDTCDLLEMLLNDSETRVVMLLLEGLRRPIRFLGLARRARECGVPLVAFKLARSPRAAAAALAHTGMLAGRRRVQRAAFRQLGILEAETLDELVDLAVLFAAYPEPLGGRLGAVTTSGGGGILIGDLCDELGMDLPALNEATANALRTILPAYVSIANPLDVTAGLPESTLLQALARLADDPRVDVVLALNTMIGGAAKLAERAGGLVRTGANISKPLLTCWLGGSLAAEGLAIYREAGQPYFLSLEACLRGVAAAREYHARRAAWMSG
ncbi:MAG TPA: CoA-binding protein [Chloroflexota bacterium]|nr:CoA-binding protein [Chloroflexota bacterium]